VRTRITASKTHQAAISTTTATTTAKAMARCRRIGLALHWRSLAAVHVGHMRVRMMQRFVAMAASSIRMTG
jgi:hypothetical protein